jgi:hypothetical protein
MVLWALALVQSRGSVADPQTFRYAYFSLGLALLAIVPRRPVRGSITRISDGWRWVPAVAVVALVALLSARSARAELQFHAIRNDALGREAEGTLLVLSLGPEVIPDDAPIKFFGFDRPHGTALRLRALVDRYGSPLDATVDDIDRQLADLDIVRRRRAGLQPHPGCTPLTRPVSVPGIPARGLAAVEPGDTPWTELVPLTLWSEDEFEIEVRRFGEEWVSLGRVRPERNVQLELPALNTDVPWQVRADGACDVSGARDG